MDINVIEEASVSVSGRKKWGISKPINVVVRSSLKSLAGFAIQDDDCCLGHGDCYIS